uniref:PCNA_C domain-containing protein n=1 Tax=Heterorhabditis bacteriophora TaxID=37862 RepID=A0A1I7X9F4_HETBA
MRSSADNCFYYTFIFTFSSSHCGLTIKWRLGSHCFKASEILTSISSGVCAYQRCDVDIIPLSPTADDDDELVSVLFTVDQLLRMSHSPPIGQVTLKVRDTV